MVYVDSMCYPEGISECALLHGFDAVLEIEWEDWLVLEEYFLEGTVVAWQYEQTGPKSVGGVLLGTNLVTALGIWGGEKWSTSAIQPDATCEVERSQVWSCDPKVA